MSESKVKLSTRNVGIHFGTVGTVRRHGREIAASSIVRPYGFHAAALSDAAALAKKLGLTTRAEEV